MKRREVEVALCCIVYEKSGLTMAHIFLWEGLKSGPKNVNVRRDVQRKERKGRKCKRRVVMGVTKAILCFLLPLNGGVMLGRCSDGQREAAFIRANDATTTAGDDRREGCLTNWSQLPKNGVSSGRLGGGGGS